MALHWILHVGILMLGLARADNDEFQQDNPYCSGDIGCQSPTQAAGGNMYTESSQMMKPHEIMQTMIAVQLYNAQREVAHSLEMAYLHLGDHPEQAREIRLTAHQARTLHLMTSGLMKKFTMTAAHIVNTMIPMILDAVDLQDVDIVRKAFNKIIEIANKMKHESEHTKESYVNVQLKVQENLASVEKRNDHVVKEGERLKIEREKETRLAAAAKRAEQELERERKQMAEELEILKENRDKWMDAAMQAGKNVDSGGTFFDVLGTGAALGGGGIGMLAAAGMNIFSSMFGKDKNQEQREKFMEAYRESENKVHQMMKEKRSVVEKSHDKRKEAFERLATLQQIALETAELGDVESLIDASEHIGKVDTLLTKIIMFWENMAVTLKYLRDDTNAGEVYLDKIENPKYAERFKRSIAEREKDWKFFGRISSDYVVESDTEINNLYNFLGAKIGSLDERNNRKKQLVAAIEQDIKAMYGEEIPQEDEN